MFKRSLIWKFAVIFLPLQAAFPMITVQPLHVNDEKWFAEIAVQSVILAHQGQVLVMSYKDDVIVIPDDPVFNNFRKLFWRKIFRGAFQEYVKKPCQSSYRAIKILHNGYCAGALCYRLVKNGVIYIDQIFVTPSFQKKGIARYILNKWLPKQHPTYKCYQLVTRHQNRGALKFYKKIGFNVGNVQMVSKYKYDPRQFLPLVREIKGRCIDHA